MEETVLVATETLTPLKEAADVLQLSATWLRGEALAGRVPCLKAGKEVLFNLPALRRVLYARAATEFLPAEAATVTIERSECDKLLALCEGAMMHLRPVEEVAVESNLKEMQAILLPLVLQAKGGA